eukprot:8590934-Alexandrium_andersonii.AAC.1
MHKPVPHVNLLVGGVICKSVSTQHTKRGDYLDCVRSKAGKTGEAYGWLIEYITAHKPDAFLGEQVVGFRAGNNNSNLECIAAEFNSLGYDFASHEENTVDWGIPHHRRRLWMLARRRGSFNHSPLRVCDLVAHIRGNVAPEPLENLLLHRDANED